MTVQDIHQMAKGIQLEALQKSAEPGIDKALGEIKAERAFQIDKWGLQNHDPAVWMTILMEEVGELAERILCLRCGIGSTELVKDDIRHEACQVAAVAAAIMQAMEEDKV